MGSDPARIDHERALCGHLQGAIMSERKSVPKKKPAAKAKAEPWDEPNPKGAGEHHHLSPKAKASAKRHASAAGRPYPNLVDNMRAAARSKK
jgi:hypothetical protein